MNLPKLIILDRDGVLNYHSKDPASPLYYVTKPEHVVIKPGVREAVELIRAHGVPVVIATKQRASAKAQVLELTRLVCLKAGMGSPKCYIETISNDKTALFRAINEDYSDASDSIVLFDDSPIERAAAASFGIVAFDGIDLLESVKKALGVA